MRRALWLWVSVLMVAAGGGLFGIPARAGGDDSGVVVTGGPPEATVLGDVMTAPPEPAPPMAALTQSPGSSSTSPAPSTSVVRPVGVTTVAPSAGHEDDGRPGQMTVKTPPSVPPDATGRHPCIVEVDLTIGSRLKIASAEAGKWGSSPLHVKNCRPRVGDVVSVRANPIGLFAVTQVAFGDGTTTGPATSSCNPVLMNGVEDEHRYATPGRYLLEATTRYPCNPPGYEVEPVVNRVEIDVTDPRPPEAPGAARCSGLGPVKPGEPARQGFGRRPVDTRFGPVDARLMRCSVPLGQQSEVYLFWYEAQAIVDWSDGTPPEKIGRTGQQGVSSIHTHTERGTSVVTVWVLGSDGTPGAPVTFTQQVT